MSTNSTARHSARKSTIVRPAKPTDDFPLQPHASGHWSKRVRGRLCYFGRWSKKINGCLVPLPKGGNWKAALAKYESEIENLKAGRVPSANSCDPDGLRVGELCNKFLHAQRLRAEAKEPEIVWRSFREYKEACDELVAEFKSHRLVDDLVPADFQNLKVRMAKRWGAARVGKFITLIRKIFSDAKDDGLIKKEILFGSAFKAPCKKKAARKKRAANGKKLFTAAEIRLILEVLDGKEVDVTAKTGKQSKVMLPPNPQLKAIVLLAINAGLGNTDISSLLFSHLDLDSAWLDYPRQKTSFPRRVPLWPQTVAALQAHIAHRRDAKHEDDAKCIFLNRAGRRMVQVHVDRADDDLKIWAQDYVSSQFHELLRKLHINGRKGLGFYSIRHTFTTVALGANDRDAVSSLMGHDVNDTVSIYDETGPSDERLVAVSDHVRSWLFETADH